MNPRARIVGVHPVDAAEPCHLCELVVENASYDIEFGEFTQPIVGRDRSYWQVPYDERLISKTKEFRSYVFFFHYLDIAQPMQSPFGALELPEPTARPARLNFITYESP